MEEEKNMGEIKKEEPAKVDPVKVDSIPIQSNAEESDKEEILDAIDDLKVDINKPKKRSAFMTFTMIMVMIILIGIVILGTILIFYNISVSNGYTVCQDKMVNISHGYNSLVAEYNNLVTENNQLVDRYNDLTVRYNNYNCSY